MSNMPKHVIEDLIPAYLAGDVSDETKVLIEQEAQENGEIAELIKSAKVNEQQVFDKLSDSAIAPTKELEFQTLNRLRHNIRKKMLLVAVATMAILMVPLTAMNYTNEVNWDLMDFVVMAIMLMGAGLTYVFIANLSKDYAYKLAVAIAVITGFLIIWGNLAVGFIGTAGNSANLLYLFVFAVGGWKALQCKMTPTGMAQAMYYSAITLFLIPLVAISFWPSSTIGDGSLISLFILNTFFALLLTFSGLLFQKANKNI